MVLRWMAVGMSEVERQFRRINGYRDLHVLKRALERHEEVTGSTREKCVKLSSPDRPKIYRHRDILLR